MKRIILSCAALILSTAAQADWYTPSLSSPVECMVAGKGDHPANQWADTYGPENVMATPIKRLESGDHLVAVAVHMHGEIAVYTYASSREACLKADSGDWADLDTAGLRKSAKAELKQAGDPWYVVAPRQQSCVALSSVLPGAKSPEDYIAFARKGHITYSVQTNGPDIAILVDKKQASPSIAMVRGQDRCALAARMIAGL